MIEDGEQIMSYGADIWMGLYEDEAIIREAVKKIRKSPGRK